MIFIHMVDINDIISSFVNQDRDPSETGVTSTLLMLRILPRTLLTYNLDFDLVDQHSLPILILRNKNDILF